MSAALLALVLTAGTPAPSAVAAPGALDSVAQQLADGARGLGTPQRLVVAVHVGSPDTGELARAFQTVLAARLGAGGFREVLPLSSPTPEEAEAESRRRGADWLLRLTVRIEGPELVAAGDAVPTWVSFWAGASPVRAPGGAALAARATTDALALTLANAPLAAEPAPAEVATRFQLRKLFAIPERVLGLAAGDLDEDGKAEIALLTPSQVLLTRLAGEPVARRDLSALPRAARPPRDPAGALAIGDWGIEPAKPRLAAAAFGRARGEVYELAGAELKPVQTIEWAPLCAGSPGAVIGRNQPGTHLLSPEVRSPAGRQALLPFAPIAVAAHPGAAAPFYLAVGPDGAAAFLSPELRPLDRPLPPLGAAVALGDVDGDGQPEIAASLLTRSDDRVRLLRAADPSGAPLFESEPVPGVALAAASADLDGDQRAEAVFAFWTADGGTVLFALGAER